MKCEIQKEQVEQGSISKIEKFYAEDQNLMQPEIFLPLPLLFFHFAVLKVRCRVEA